MYTRLSVIACRSLAVWASCQLTSLGVSSRSSCRASRICSWLNVSRCACHTSSVARSFSSSRSILVSSSWAVRVGDTVRARLFVGDSKDSGAGRPYLCGGCPSFGSGYCRPLWFPYLSDWLLAFLNTFPAGGELFPHFPNTGVSVRLTYRVGVYRVLPRSLSR